MTGGYVQQVPYPEGGAQTQRSQLGKDFVLATGLYDNYTYVVNIHCTQ